MALTIVHRSFGAFARPKAISKVPYPSINSIAVAEIRCSSKFSWQRVDAQNSLVDFLFGDDWSRLLGQSARRTLSFISQEAFDRMFPRMGLIGSATSPFLAHHVISLPRSK
jgi:hypothetical protein